MSARLIAAIALGTAVAACGGARAEDPHAVLRSYSRALDEGRAEDAYRMLSEEARRGISLEAFRRMVKDNPEEVREIARALARPTATPVVTATVMGANGQELQLVLENGRSLRARHPTPRHPGVRARRRAQALRRRPQVRARCAS
jgi:hypothetical protein